MSHRYGEKYYKIWDPDDGAIWLLAEDNPGWEGAPVYYWSGSNMVSERAWNKEQEKENRNHDKRHIRGVHIAVTAGESRESEGKEGKEKDCTGNQGRGVVGRLRGLLHRICACIRFDRGFHHDG